MDVRKQLDRKIRDRYLTKEEAEKYNRIREQIKKEFPPLKESDNAR